MSKRQQDNNKSTTSQPRKSNFKKNNKKSNGPAKLKVPAPYDGVPILLYIPNKPSPNWEEWNRKITTRANEKFGRHASFFKTGKMFKPGDLLDEDLSTILSEQDDIDADDETADETSSIQPGGKGSKAAPKKSRAPAKSSSSSGGLAGQPTAADEVAKARQEALENKILEERIRQKVKHEGDDRKDIRDHMPVVYSWILQTICEEGKDMLEALDIWETEIDGPQHPLKLRLAVDRYIKYGGVHVIEQPESVEDAARNNIDNCTQQSHESLSTYHRRFKDSVKALHKIVNVDKMSDVEQVRKFRAGLDKLRYERTLINMDNKVTEGSMKRIKILQDFVNYLMLWVPDATYSQQHEPRVSTIFAADGGDEDKSKQQQQKKKKPQQQKQSRDEPSESKPKSGEKASNDKASDREDPPRKPCTICPSNIPESQRMHWMRNCPNAEAFRQYMENKSNKKGTADMNVCIGCEDTAPAADGFDVMFTTTTDRLVHAFKSGSLGPCCIGLDTYANVSLISNPDLATYVEELDEPRRIRGIGGFRNVNRTAWVKNIGRCLYDPNAGINVLSFSNVIRNVHLDLEFHKNRNAFTVTDLRTGRVMYFKHRGGCYICDLSIINDDFDPIEQEIEDEGVDTTTNSEQQHQMYLTEADLVDHSDDEDDEDDPRINQLTVKQLAELYPRRQLNKLAAVRELSRKLAFPSPPDLVEIVKQGIEDNEVQVTDVHRAERILGQDAAAVKGKAVKKKNEPLEFEPISRGALTLQTLHSDLMFVRKTAFLVSVATPLNLTLANHLPEGKSAPSLDKAIRHQFATMGAQGFKIKLVLFDGESSIGTVSNSIRELGSECEQLPSGSHVEVVERKQRVIKERCRSVLASLFFRLPMVLVVMMVYFCVSRINMMPSKLYDNRVSPRENFLGRKITAKDISCYFGEYVLVHEERQFTNTMEPRAQEAIALLPLGNLTGSCKFFTIKTHRIITRSHWTKQPVIPDWVKEDLDSLSAPPNPDEPNVPTVDEDPDLQIQVEPKQSERLPLLDEVHQVPIRSDPTQLQGDSPPVPISPAVKNVEETPAHPQVVETSTYNLRESATNWKNKFDDKIYNMSCTTGIQRYGKLAVESIYGEVKQIDEKGTFQVRDPTKLTQKELAGVIPSHMFLKDKFKSTGEFDKLKSRLVGGGNKQDRSLYEDVSSPSVSTSAVFMVAAIAAAERRTVVTVDIAGAYLNAKMPDDSNVLMRLDPTISDILCTIHPSYRKLLTKNKTLIVRLNKALYGCIESAKLWYEDVSAFLISQGYTPNPAEPCVFNKEVDGKQCTICLYVDDLKITCAVPGVIDQLLQQLTDKYKTLTVHQGLVHSYLGMTFDYSVPGKAKVTMEKYVADILTDYNITGAAATPAACNLFDIDEDSDVLSEDRSTEFHSRVAKVLFLAKRVRPDTLTATAFLTTRVAAPTEQDWNKLERLLKYIRSTASFGIVLEASKNLAVLAWIDASYGVHPDGKSHSGLVISLGRGAVMVKSVKQKIVSKSSTESELIGLSDHSTPAIWTRDFLTYQGYEMDPATVYQDNKSTICMAEKGRSTSDRTRHIAIRYFWVKDRIAAREMKVEYLPTANMLADILTKPLQGELFRALRKELLNWEE